jgi:hypothetical protein
MSDTTRKYVSFDPTEGYPAKLGLFYECTRCGDVVASVPKDNVGCKCDNIFIDVDAGRMAVRDASQLKLFSTS